MKAGTSSTERGTTMVEAAIIMPLFFFLIFAVIDGALLFKSYLTAGYATKAAARADADAARDSLADYDALTAISKGSTGFDRNAVQRVIVFHAQNVSSQPTASCLSGTPSTTPGTECNVYSSKDLSLNSDGFLSSPDSLNWNAQSRVDSQSAPPNGPDFVGVTIVANVSTPFSTYGRSFWTVRRTTVVQIEPRAP